MAGNSLHWIIFIHYFYTNDLSLTIKLARHQTFDTVKQKDLDSEKRENHKLTANQTDRKLDGTSQQLYDPLLSEQFPTHFGLYCVVTLLTLKPTDAITKDYRQELLEMLLLNHTLHITGSLK